VAVQLAGIEMTSELILVLDCCALLGSSRPLHTITTGMQLIVIDFSLLLSVYCHSFLHFYCMLTMPGVFLLLCQ